MLFPDYVSDEKNLVHAADHLAQSGPTGAMTQIAVLALATGALAVSAWHSRRTLLRALLEATARQRLSRHFPRPILQKLLAPDYNVPKLQPARAAVMFVDVCGFTRFAEIAQPSAVAAFLEDFRSEIQKAVEMYDGIVDKFIGDGVLVVFGLQQARGDEAYRALACALELRRRLERHAIGGDFARELRVGIGLHFGDVIAGLIGNEDRVEFTVLGDTVNVAARLQQLANSRDGQTIASSDLVEAAGCDPETWGEILPAQTLKGRTEIIRPVRVTARTLPHREALTGATVAE
jgi:adenylate cyclase